MLGGDTVATERNLIIFLLFVSGTFLINSMLTLPLYNRGVLGPGFFPVMISTILILLLLLSLIISLKKLKKNTNDSTKPRVSKKTKFKRLNFVIVLLGSVALINVLGMLASLGIFLFVGLLFVEKLTWVKSLQFSLGMVLFIYFVFDKWL